MKKVLDINYLDAFPNVFPHEAILNGIIDTQICSSGLIGELQVSTCDESLTSWTVKNNNSKVIIDNNNAKIYANKYAKDVNGVLYKRKKSNQRIELIIHVVKQANWNPWSYISLFTNEDNEFEKLIDNWTDIDKILVCSKNGVIVINENTEMCCKVNPNINNYWLKLYADDECIKYCYSLDGVEWVDVKTKITDKDVTFCYGIMYNFKEAVYYNWFFHHYLLTSYSQNMSNSVDGTPVEFYNEIYKDYNNYLFHPYFKFFTIPQNYIYGSEKDEHENSVVLFNVIKQAIDLGNCVEIQLNEYYVENRGAYGVDNFYHTNIIYGYNDDIREFYILGNNSTGKFSSSKIGYANFILANLNGRFDLHIIQCDYPFSPSLIKKDDIVLTLKRYIDSIDISREYEFISPKRFRKFGFSIYDAIINNDFNLSAILKDIRISHFLYEHIKVLNELCIFMMERRMITSGSYKFLSTQLENLVLKALILRNVICKNQVKSQTSSVFINKIKRMLTDIKNIEFKLINLIISELI